MRLPVTASFHQFLWRRCVRRCLQERLLESGWFLQSCAICTNIACLQTPLPTGAFAESVVEKGWLCRTAKPWPHEMWMASDRESSDCHNVNISLHQQYTIPNLVSCTWNKCSSSQCSCRQYNLTCTTFCKCMGGVEQRVKIPLPDSSRIATAKIEWLVITATLSQTNVI